MFSKVQIMKLNLVFRYTMITDKISMGQTQWVSLCSASGTSTDGVLGGTSHLLPVVTDTPHLPNWVHQDWSEISGTTCSRRFEPCDTVAFLLPHIPPECPAATISIARYYRLSTCVEVTPVLPDTWCQPFLSGSIQSCLQTSPERHNHFGVASGD